MKYATLVLGLSLSLVPPMAVTARAAERMPRSYHGNWCLVTSIENGHDAITRERIPRESFYRRGDGTAECDDFILINAKSYSTHDSECRILRASKIQIGHRVTYDCGLGAARMTIHRDKNKLFIEQ